MIVRWAPHLAAALLAGATLGGVPVAAAQDATVLDDPRLSDVRQRLEGSLDRAVREGLPAQVLVDKVREGLAKHVAPPRIAMAVQMLLGHLRTAGRLLEPVPRHRRVGRDDLIRSGAEALMAGAGASELGRLVQTIVREEDGGAAPLVREGLVVVAELAERGIEGHLAADSARRAFETQGRRGWSELLRTVRSLSRASASERARAIRRAAERPRNGAPGFDGHPHGGAKGHAKAKGR